MILLYILLVALVGFMLFMVKQANENNVRQHEISLSGEEQTLRLFFISDTHNRTINEDMILAIQEPIDVVIIGGDFVDKRTGKETLIHNIRLLKQLGPVYFVWGNNDREMGERQLRAILNGADVTILDNCAERLAGSKNPVWLSGIDYYPEAQSIPSAFAECKADPTIFIAHNPQVFPKIRAQYRPILMMGGHLHGGQIRFGKFGMHGPGTFKKRGGIHTLISNGYGTTLLPMRFSARPECHIVTIHFTKIAI